MKSVRQIAAALLLCVGSTLVAQKGSDTQIQADVTKALAHKRFSNVKAVVKSGVVSLNGTVGVFSEKEDADHRVHRVNGVTSVRNMIDVTSTSRLSDTELRDKLAEKLSYDRIGYGTTAYNSFTIGVQAGVVTLGGVAYGPADRDSAVSLVSNYPGVKDVVDDIEIAPLSPNDDRIRLDVARAVYGFASLNKYAIDPAKPIRITVVNGNVTLSGVVNNQADKDAAGLRANGVSGVFKVTNALQSQAKKSPSSSRPKGRPYQPGPTAHVEIPASTKMKARPYGATTAVTLKPCRPFGAARESRWK